VKKVFFFLLLILAAFGAQARSYNPGELDALLAPVALYPDPLLAHVLNAAAFPQDVAVAAQWRRENAHLSADDALRAVEGQMWHPSVKALVAQPDVLQRMAESPEWLAALGEAYLGQPQEVHATVQQLRMRAQSTGSLRSDENQYVYQQAQTIVVQPVYPNVVYAPYYNPYVVYGGWRWAAYRPVFFRPWVPCAVRVTHFVPVVPLRPWPVARTGGVYPGNSWSSRSFPRTPLVQEPRPGPQFRQPGAPATRMPTPTIQSTPYRAIPESRRAPIVQSPTVYFKNSSNPMRGGSNFGRGSGGGRHRS
jgi:hypothetical protein